MALFKHLNPIPRPHSFNGRICLLLDVSYSMSMDDGNGRRIDLLRKAVDTVPNLGSTPIYCFSSAVEKVENPTSIPEPSYSTALHFALQRIKADGFTNAILITDGEPDSEELALRDARGLRLGIIYVGPEPVPAFMRRLAQITGGTFDIQSLANTKQLSQKIAGYLPA